MSRINQMSKRRRKIAWRRFIKAEIAKSLRKILVGKIAFDNAGYTLVRDNVNATLERIIAKL